MEGTSVLNFLENNMFDLSKKVIDYLWQKQTITSNNIANAETPGYKAKYITFEEELQKRLDSQYGKTANEIKRGIASVRPEIHKTTNESSRMDENNVNVDVESMELAKAALQYEFMLKSLNDDLTRLRTVIKG